jgi:HAD superfamily hydrolase (TIGR01509 family)
LSKLKNDGYRLAVCSNSIRKTIEVMMEKSSLISYLEFFLSNQDVVKGKPDPEMYIKAIKLLKLKPPECLVVEDNENGVKAAKASGAHVLRVNNIHDVTYQAITQKITSLA